MSTADEHPLDRAAIERDGALVESIRRGEQPLDRDHLADMLAAWRDETLEQRRSVNTIAGLVAVVVVLLVLVLVVLAATYGAR